MDSRTLFGVLGSLTAFITFLLPARMLFKIWKGQKVLPGRSMVQYQYHAAIISCALWEMYGQVHDDKFLMDINFTGFIVQIIYLDLFIQTRYLNRSLTGGARVDMLKSYGKHFVIVLCELFCLYLVAGLAIISQDPATFAGTFCAAGTSFICVMKMLYEPKEEPFVYEAFVYEFLASLVNGVIWSVYAVIASDTFILVPNLVGGIVGLVQLVQYVICRRSPPAQRQIEMGAM